MSSLCPKCHTANTPGSKFCSSCGLLLDSIDKIPVSQTKTIETPIEKLSTGTTFAGRYQIIEELGKGGMGRVYRVLDKELNEEIALKLIKPEIASDNKIVDRFKNELILARKISQKNVGKVYELLEEKGTRFITMEYVSGGDLKKFIRRSGQMGIGKAISIAKQICDGLHEAHDLGIVHRDLKPNNIMIDDRGNARIMDFGIARTIKSKGLTGSGIMIGTPEYMSPEQAEARGLDHRSDIYSLGIILYEMTTGNLPFQGDSPLALAMKHKGEAPKNPKEINPQIPDDLSFLILKCLEKDKEIRYQNTDEVKSELEKIERGIPTTDRVLPQKKTHTSKEITVTFGLKKLFVPGIVVILIAVMAFLVLYKGGSNIDPNRIFVASFQNQTGEYSLDSLGKITADWIIQGLLKSDWAEVVPSKTVLQLTSELNLEDKDSRGQSQLQFLAKKFRAGIVVSGNYHLMDGNVRFQTEIVQSKSSRLLFSFFSEGSAEEPMAVVNSLREKIMGGLSLHFDSVNMLTAGPKPPVFEAYSAYLTGIGLFDDDLTESLKHLERAVSLSPEFIPPYILMAYGYGNRGDWDVVKSIIERLNQKRELLSPSERHMVDANAARVEGNWNNGLEHYRELGKMHPQDVGLNYQWGLYALHTLHLEEVVWVRSQIQLEDHLDIFGAGWWNRAWFGHLINALHGLGQYKRELKEIARAQKIYPDWFHTYKARALAALGKISEVKDVIDESFSITSRANAAEAVMVSAAYALRKHGHLNACGETVNRMIEWYESRLAQELPTRSLLTEYAQALYIAGRWQDAHALYEKLAAKFPDNITYRGCLGSTEARLGNSERALQISDELKNLDQPYLRGENTYRRALIASVLEDKEQAVSLLRESLAQGKTYSQWLFNELDLEPLYDYKPFQELVTPKDML
ncbi:protein kinase [Acidobacteriota bacterium]